MKPFVHCKQAPPLVSFDTWSMVKVMSGHFLALGWDMFGFSANESVSLVGTWTIQTRTGLENNRLFSDVFASHCF